MTQSESPFRDAGCGAQGPRVPRHREQGQEEQAPSPIARSCTSLGRNGLKKQSSSLRRLMVRLLLVEAITSFTECRTKVIDPYSR